jgi:hypothetical protein
VASPDLITLATVKACVPDRLCEIRKSDHGGASGPEKRKDAKEDVVNDVIEILCLHASAPGDLPEQRQQRCIRGYDLSLSLSLSLSLRSRGRVLAP